MSWQGAQKRSEHRNYFLGKEKENWNAEIPLFGQAIGTGSGFSVDFHAVEGRLKYNLEFENASRSRSLFLRFLGADQLSLAGNELAIRTSVNGWQEAAPQSWQVTGGQTQPIASAYRLSGDTLRFELGDYLADAPLTIDPEVVFSTYAGASMPNWGACAANTPDGSLYAGAIAFNTGYPATAGAFQLNFAGGAQDMIITKYSPTGIPCCIPHTSAACLSGTFPSACLPAQRRIVCPGRFHFQ